jgi:hypothetical protein
MLGKRAHISLLFFCPLGWFSSFFFFSLSLVPGRQHSRPESFVEFKMEKINLQITEYKQPEGKERGKNTIQAPLSKESDRNSFEGATYRSIPSHHQNPERRAGF